MTDLDDGDRQFGVINGIEDPVVTLSEAIFLLAGQLFTASWTRLRSQSLNPARDTSPGLELECSEFLDC